MHNKKLTILVAPENEPHHVNACAGALASLKFRGHRVIFVLEFQLALKSRLSALGYEEHVYKLSNMYAENELSRDSWEIIGHCSPKDSTEPIHNSEFYLQLAYADKVIKKAIKHYHPDLIYFSGQFLPASIYYSKIPWIMSVASNPLSFLLDDTGDEKLLFELPKFYTIRRPLLYSKKYNDLLEQNGYDRFPSNIKCPRTQLMTVYAYPEELNYPIVRRQGWFNLEQFNKCEKGEKVKSLRKLVSYEFLSDSLDGKFSGKIIYISLGCSMSGIVDVDLMKRLVRIFGKTSHKFIIATGPRKTEYDLTRNMTADRNLFEPALIPHIDLILTHGSNQTVTEVFANGKPMIILPLFGDQHDNAKRIQKLSYGIQLDYSSFTDLQLIVAVDTLLHSEELNIGLSKAAGRIQALRRHEKLAFKIEELLLR